jgi:hypothetical protein
MKLLLVDGIGPFFRHCQTQRINWSKIPFASLERDGRLDSALRQEITRDFRTLARRCAETGFTGVTLDDVAHLSVQPEYPDDLNELIRDFRCAYQDLFQIAEQYGMGVYLTTDVMFYPATAEPGADSMQEARARLERVVADVLKSFPHVRGIIFRLGECDGSDVQDRFRSRLLIRKPREARTLIQALLPVFEKHDRLMIVRTWTVGAYAIGDLIWNRNTFDRVFGGIESPHLVISLKYGESDFFRYLPLNKLFFRSEHKKIIELQARREYEGAGQYPSFIGWDYEQMLRQLAGARNVIGAWVWIQTGGWTTFRRLTWLDDAAIWNELNAFVCAQLLHDGCSTEEAVERFGRTHLKIADIQKLLIFLRLSDEAIKELLYVDQLARRKLFFRRVRVPPLLSVFWDQIIVNHSMRKLLRCFVTDPDDAILQGRTALSKIEAMRELAHELGLPASDIDFQYDTFEIIAVAREYYFGAFDESVVQRLQHLRQAYRQKHRTRYSVRLDFSPFPLSRRSMRLLLGLWMRDRRGYRRIDRILMIRILSWLSPVLLISRHRSNADLLNDRAMGIEAVLK